MIIDVEGYKGEVLRGADAVLRRFRPRLYIEIHDTWDEIEGILRAYGYVVRAWKGNRPERGAYLGYARGVGVIPLGSMYLPSSRSGYSRRWP